MICVHNILRIFTNKKVRMYDLTAFIWSPSCLRTSSLILSSEDMRIHVHQTCQNKSTFHFFLIYICQGKSSHILELILFYFLFSHPLWFLNIDPLKYINSNIFDYPDYNNKIGWIILQTSHAIFYCQILIIATYYTVKPWFLSVLILLDKYWCNKVILCVFFKGGGEVILSSPFRACLYDPG